MSKGAINTGKFFVVFIATTVFCAVVWQYTVADLYDCTDSVFPGYLEFGWVHSWEGHPVATVRQIVHDRSMSEPDTIKEGWTVPRLWVLWSVFFIPSLVVSALLARVSWERTH